METEIVKIDNLSQEQVELINKYILPEFGEYIIKPLRFEDSSRFVFIKDKGEVLSFARIFETKLEFNNKQSDILGLSMVYSVVKEKGYGKELIKQIKQISDNEGKILIGNCKPNNKDFYIKCGLEVLENTIKRFVYINSRNIAEINHNNSILLIHDPKNLFINEFNLSSENVFIFEHWW